MPPPLFLLHSKLLCLGIKTYIELDVILHRTNILQLCSIVYSTHSICTMFLKLNYQYMSSYLIMCMFSSATMLLANILGSFF